MSDTYTKLLNQHIHENGGVTEFYVGTGMKAVFFTLWSIYKPPGRHWGHSQFIQNLAEKREDAIAKAFQLTGLDLSKEVYEVDKEGKRQDYHHYASHILHFGKYRGQSISEVYRQDPKYIHFMAQSTFSSSWEPIQRNMAVIQAMYGETVIEQQYWRDSEKWVKDFNTPDFPTTSDRVTVVGRVVGNPRVEDTQFGLVTKILVETVEGWRAWGSAATSLGEVHKNDWVSFSAKLQPSNKGDKKFGFFSRPTKATNNGQVNVADEGDFGSMSDWEGE